MSAAARASRHCSSLSPPGAIRYRSSTPRLTAPHCSGSANSAATRVCSATAAAKIGHRADSVPRCRSGTSTGFPVVAASMQAPSFRVNCRSSSSSAVASVAHRVSRDTLAVSSEIAAPSTSSPSRQAWQMRPARSRSSTSSRASPSSAWVTVPTSVTIRTAARLTHVPRRQPDAYGPWIASVVMSVSPQSIDSPRGTREARQGLDRHRPCRTRYALYSARASEPAVRTAAAPAIDRLSSHLVLPGRRRAAPCWAR